MALGEASRWLTRESVALLATVTELRREPAKLVSGIGLRQRARALRNR